MGSFFTFLCSYYKVVVFIDPLQGLYAICLLYTSTEIEQREPAIAETEQRITELEQQLEKGRLIDERIKKLKERR